VLPEMNEWHTTVGINGMRQWNTNKGEEVIIPEYGLTDIGAFVFAQRFFKKTTLSGGLRFDNRSVDSEEFMEGPEVKFTAFKRSFSNVSGSIGISYEPSAYLTLKANLARGFRAPNMAELASNGAHEGTNRYEYGDQQLQSETSWQADGGIDFNYDHVNISLSLFYNRINDFIYYRKLESVFGGDSLVNVDGEDIQAFRFDGNNARLYGLEASIDLHPHPLDWLHFENTFSFVRGKFDNTVDGTENLPLIPAPRWTSELRANFLRPGKFFRNVYIRTELQKTFDQRKPFTAYGTETATAGYSLWNAGMGSDIFVKGKTLFSFHFAALNIADIAYQQHLSRLKYAAENLVTGRTGVFNAGRNFSFKINIPFQF
jgi:iron complex outermembrane receptor protein